MGNNVFYCFRLSYTRLGSEMIFPRITSMDEGLSGLPRSFSDYLDSVDRGPLWSRPDWPILGFSSTLSDGLIGRTSGVTFRSLVSRSSPVWVIPSDCLSLGSLRVFSSVFTLPLPFPHTRLYFPSRGTSDNVPPRKKWARPRARAQGVSVCYKKNFFLRITL